MKPALIAMAISIALIVVAAVVYTKATEKAAANMGIQSPTK